MTTLKTVSAAAAVWSLALMVAPLAHAQASTAATGSTDIYSTNFQEKFTTAGVTASEPSASISSTDIYSSDFSKAFPSAGSIHGVQDTAAYHGSTDIYSTDFQKGAL
jgi:hypothetical protein